MTRLDSTQVDFMKSTWGAGVASRGNITSVGFGQSAFKACVLLELLDEKNLPYDLKHTRWEPKDLDLLYPISQSSVKTVRI